MTGTGSKSGSQNSPGPYRSGCPVGPRNRRGQDLIPGDLRSSAVIRSRQDSGFLRSLLATRPRPPPQAAGQTAVTLTIYKISRRRNKDRVITPGLAFGSPYFTRRRRSSSGGSAVPAANFSIRAWLAFRETINLLSQHRPGQFCAAPQTFTWDGISGIRSAA